MRIFDVRIFNPCAHSNRTSQVASAYHCHEPMKCREYEQRVQEVEMASFFPLVFSASGGLTPAATTTFKRLAAVLADKWSMQYST